MIQDKIDRVMKKVERHMRNLEENPQGWMHTETSGGKVHCKVIVAPVPQMHVEARGC